MTSSVKGNLYIIFLILFSPCFSLTFQPFFPDHLHKLCFLSFIQKTHFPPFLSHPSHCSPISISSSCFPIPVLGFAPYVGFGFLIQGKNVIFDLKCLIYFSKDYVLKHIHSPKNVSRLSFFMAQKCSLANKCIFFMKPSVDTVFKV